jgi:DsbC/DsbD-like thiol-disulfide interchange protein
MVHDVSYRATIATVALFLIPGMTVARAQDASPWKMELHAASRLIAGAVRRSAGTLSLRAGIEIRLDPDWHTYWRYPGDAGVPPTFDFSDSENVMSVTVLWPAPKRLADSAGGHSIGYVGDVVFPLRITARDETLPSSLHVRLGYAYCREVCVPAEADLDLKLSGESGTEEPALVAAEARVPRHASLGVGTGLVIQTVHRDGAKGHQHVVVVIGAPAGAPIDLFVEGPTRDWALPLPDPIDPTPSGATQVRRFRFDLDGLPPDAHADGAIMTFTAVSPDDAIEVAARLD